MSGPESVVKLVTAAQARVVIQPSGIDVDQTVDLVAVDVRGEVVGPVDVEPSSVHVRIAVGSGLRSKSLPVNPIVTGTPAVGYEIASVTVSPPIVSVEGDADALAALAAGRHGAAVGQRCVHRPDPERPARSPGWRRFAVRDDGRGHDHARSRSPATRTYSSGIVLSGARDDRTYQLSTDSVLVTVGGTVAALDALDPRVLAVVADVDGLGPGAHKVKLKISLPADVKLVGMSPAEITVTVADAASPSPPPSAGAVAERPVGGPPLRNGRDPRCGQRRSQADDGPRPRPRDRDPAGRAGPGDRRGPGHPTLGRHVRGRDRQRGDEPRRRRPPGRGRPDARRSRSSPARASSPPGSWSRRRTTRPRTTASRSWTRPA